MCDRQESFSPLDKSTFLPSLSERGFSEEDAPKFLPNPGRKNAFSGKTFIFLTESKVCSQFPCNSVLVSAV